VCGEERELNRDDLNQLLNVLIPFAQQTLGHQGGFLPFAAALSTEGKVEVIAGHPGSEETTAQEIHDVLLEGLKQGARDGKYRATGLCYEVRVRRGDADPGTDAIALALEHSDGTALDLYVPYEKKSASEINYGDLFGTAGQGRVFPLPPTA
jgi:hypothetical protein